MLKFEDCHTKVFPHFSLVIFEVLTGDVIKETFEKQEVEKLNMV